MATPPSYNDATSNSKQIQLKDCFSVLVNDQLQIQSLFRSVAGQLETTQQIGENHPLCNEWNNLRQRHRKVYRDSQHNAGLCASFLNDYVGILIPLSQSNMALEDKKFMIMKFLEAITVHQNSARRTAIKFHELGKAVEVFQLKVASVLRNQAEPSGFFGYLWSGLEELCMSIWLALRRLLVQIADVFQSMLSRIRTIRFSCFVSVAIEFEHYYSMDPQSYEISPKVVARQIKADCKEISDKLTVFEDAWHVVRLSCNELLLNISMANSLTSIPAACDAHLRTAETVYAPLVECLRAYSVGKSPTF
ncbi:hypothetical protein AcW1_008685 [Taiwanofungus camphoratus]|nr:hypothetical protein AcW1_008685 [Antrodia cinnamomea]